ncbi:carboxymuconolactone decarboxylase family protein [Bacillus ndiopicus]|uniref:carboxymuconolactone decarboxylase family protein n=1 Tax=Bacillus ndiopicus TaxID=1347368 RepID=UPI0005AAF9BB|nr:carboxymuconolactone decarboxylase family protein [Bacillus ndiopicus]
MAKRMNYYEIAPEAMKLMIETEKYINKSSINKKLGELLKVRASQINGCAYCINVHTADAKKLGETEQRLYCLNAWRDCVFYSEEEKAALELTEHITQIADKRVPDELYEKVRKYFTEKEYIDLVIIINQINSWNRISIAMGNVAE